jgi:hypothetical protein
VSLGNVSLEWGGGVYFLFRGSAKELPTPPDYPANRAWGHCGNWGTWISKQPKIYGLLPSVHMAMTSGEPDLVVVHKVEAQIIDRTPLAGSYVLIQCQYGAGLDSGYLVTVDVGTNATNVTDTASGHVAPMPPASLSLKGRDYESAMVIIKSTPGVLYGGVISLATDINGKEQTVFLGSPKREFRWLGGGLEDAVTKQVTDQAPKYDWDITRHQWVSVDNGGPPGASTG